MNIWSTFKRANCLPDNCGCEFVQLDALIAQPSAFWSSSFHLLFAVILYFSVKEKSQSLKLWVFSLIILGLSSHFAHGSFLEFGMAMDFAGIVLILSFFPLYKWLTKWVSSTFHFVLLLLIYQIGLWMTFYSMNKWVKVGVCVVIFVVAIVELLQAEGKAFWKAKYLHWALGTILVSFGLFMIDELRIICDPHSWLTGHTVWHLGTALTLFFYGKWRFRVSPAI
jgi:hypothetical protein